MDCENQRSELQITATEVSWLRQRIRRERGRWFSRLSMNNCSQSSSPCRLPLSSVLWFCETESKHFINKPNLVFSIVIQNNIIIRYIYFY